MAITRIEDLAEYEFVSSGYEYYMRKMESNEKMEPDYYDADEVKELVNHLQSKIIKWHDAKKELPDKKGSKVFIVDDEDGVYRAFFEYDPHIEKCRFSCGHFAIEMGDGKYWCYESEILKTLPESNE